MSKKKIETITAKEKIKLTPCRALAAIYEQIVVSFPHAVGLGVESSHHASIWELLAQEFEVYVLWRIPEADLDDIDEYGYDCDGVVDYGVDDDYDDDGD